MGNTSAEVALRYEHVVDMPRWTAIARKVARTIVVVSLIPMAVFYLAYAFGGLRWAVWVTLGWYYGGLALHLVRRQPVLSATMLGAGLLTIRSVVTLWSGSAVLYFMQPVAGTVATAGAFAVTALAGRPLMDRLAHDFCPFPPAVSAQLRRARFFRYLSLIWAVTYFLNAAGTLWLLTNASLGGFLILKTVASPLLTTVAAVTSFVLFKLLMRKHRVLVRWGGKQEPLAAELELAAESAAGTEPRLTSGAPEHLDTLEPLGPVDWSGTAHEELGDVMAVVGGRGAGQPDD